MAIILVPLGKGKGGLISTIFFLIIFLTILSYLTLYFLPSLTGLTTFSQIPTTTFLIYSLTLILIGIVLFFLLILVMGSLIKN